MAVSENWVHNPHLTVTRKNKKIDYHEHPTIPTALKQERLYQVDWGKTHRVKALHTRIANVTKVDRAHPHDIPNIQNKFNLLPTEKCRPNKNKSKKKKIGLTGGVCR
jgi:hypothetical protein